MALIKCPECGVQVSITEEHCPQCISLLGYLLLIARDFGLLLAFLSVLLVPCAFLRNEGRSLSFALVGILIALVWTTVACVLIWWRHRVQRHHEPAMSARVG